MFTGLSSTSSTVFRVLFWGVCSFGTSRSSATCNGEGINDEDGWSLRNVGRSSSESPRSTAQGILPSLDPPSGLVKLPGVERSVGNNNLGVVSPFPKKASSLIRGNPYELNLLGRPAPRDDGEMGVGVSSELEQRNSRQRPKTLASL